MTRLTQPSAIKTILAEQGLSPNRAMGQNFLADRNILELILEAADLRREDRVLEVGPGLGALTEWLAMRAARVTAVEKDAGLFAWLKTYFHEAPNLNLIHGDALDLDYNDYDGNRIDKMISNLPYCVGSRILMNFFEQAHPPARILVMLQRDVAERLTATCGSSAFGLISLCAQLRYRIQQRHLVSPRCFYPPPKVHSALVVMDRLEEPAAALEDHLHFRALVKYFFTRRRKQMGTSFRGGPSRLGLGEDAAPRLLEQVGIDPRVRPENVPLDAWCRLSDLLTSVRD